MSDRNDWRRDGSSTRVENYKIEQVKDLLNKAYWLLETNLEVLEAAEKPLVNDGKKAQDVVFEALDILETELKDLPMSKLDMVVWNIEEAVEKLGKKEIEIYIKEN